jgi:hypothetical protein
MNKCSIKFSVLLVLFVMISFFLSSGYAATSPNGNTNYKEGELIIKFKSLVSEEAKNKVHQKYGSQKVKDFP